MFSFKLADFHPINHIPAYVEEGILNGELQFHIHDFTELVLFKAGTGIHLINDTQVPVRAGDVFAFKGEDGHGITQAKNLWICNIMFDHKKFLSWAADLKTLPGFQRLFVIAPHYRNQKKDCGNLRLNVRQSSWAYDLIQKMLYEYKKKKSGYLTALSSLFMLLVVGLSRMEWNSDRIDPVGIISIAAAVAHLEKNYLNPLVIKELAAIAGMSERHFFRLFSSIYGQPPLEYIIGLRIREACRLLADRHVGITETAYKCGFSDSNYFSRKFKQATGLSPRQYRGTV